MKSLRLALLLAVVLFGSAPARSQEPTPLPLRPAAAENERLRVVSAKLEPGIAVPMHRHPPRVVVALSDATLETTAPDGTLHPVTLKAGDVSFSPATEHAVRNAGARAELVEVELRGSVPAAPAPAPLPAAATVALENERVRVLRVRLAAGASADLALGEHVRIAFDGPERGAPRIVPAGTVHLGPEAPRDLVLVEPKPFTLS